MARVTFGLKVIQIAIATIIPATVIFLFSLAGQIISGKFLQGFGATPVMTMALLCIPLFSLFLITPPVARLLWVALIGIVGSLLAPLSIYILSAPGILVAGLLAVVSIALLWQRLFHHCTTVDMNFDQRTFVKPLF